MACCTQPTRDYGARRPRPWLRPEIWIAAGFVLVASAAAQAPSQPASVVPTPDAAPAPTPSVLAPAPGAAPPTPSVLVPPDVATAPSATVEEVLVEAPEPRYVAPTTRDSIGRIWAPVLINGEGPFRLVLDTGASKSAIISRVADKLALPVKTRGAQVRGVTGSAVVPTAKIRTLEFGELRIEDVTVPIVPDVFGGADGVIGGDGFKDKRIFVEFAKDRISIARSHRQPAPPGFSVIPFEYVHSRGLRTYMMVGPIRTVAVIDTGAQVTVGNLALRRSLAQRRGEKDPFDDAIIGVTEDVQAATRVRVPSIVSGDLIVRGAHLRFSDLHIFEHWNLLSEPALLIGMDVLGTLDTLVIDYRRKELQVLVRR